jgi:hypothetical protein
VCSRTLVFHLFVQSLNSSFTGWSVSCNHPWECLSREQRSRGKQADTLMSGPKGAGKATRVQRRQEVAAPMPMVAEKHALNVNGVRSEPGKRLKQRQPVRAE